VNCNFCFHDSPNNNKNDGGKREVITPKNKKVEFCRLEKLLMLLSNSHFMLHLRSASHVTQLHDSPPRRRLSAVYVNSHFLAFDAMFMLLLLAHIDISFCGPFLLLLLLLASIMLSKLKSNYDSCTLFLFFTLLSTLAFFFTRAIIINILSTESLLLLLLSFQHLTFFCDFRL
jgi:hypothetical protein